MMTNPTAIHGEHAVQFYESDAELTAAVVPYLAAGAHAGEAVIVIAEDVHHRDFEAGLEAAGVDLNDARAAEAFVSLDAATTLSALMPAGELDREAFDEVVGGVLRRAAQRSNGVRAYGEMVALLWAAGDVQSTIELEQLWNELARELGFSLFCAYPAASVDTADDRDALHEVCELHSVIVPATSAASRAATEQMRLAPKVDASASARLFVRSTLRRWGHTGEVIDSAAVVSSELATNAVVHARSHFSIEVHAEGDSLLVAVSDDVPAPLTAWPLQPRHGLSIVDSLCDRWGVTAGQHGKTVWAELSAGVAASR